MSNLCIFILAFLGVASASHVIDIKSSDQFNKEVKAYEVALVEFFAPWCGHCKKLEPEYEEAAAKLAVTDPGVKLVKVDCTSDHGKDVCGQYGVKGYPTLKLFQSGDASEYDGERKASGIVSYMRKHAGPASVLIADAVALKKKLDYAEDNIIGGFFSEVNEESKEFEKNAGKLRDSYQFFHTVLPAVWKDLYSDITEDSILLFRPKFMTSKSEPSKIQLSGDLKQALAENEQGLVSYATELNHERFLKHSFQEKKYKFHVIAYGDCTPATHLSNFKYIRNRLARVAKTETDVGFSVAVSADFKEDMSKYGIPDDEKKTVVVAKDADGKPFIMPEDFSQAAVQAFIVQLKAGEIEPFIKSEPIPEANDDAVKVVVGKTFDEIVNDESKDVLIEFYAPWCGHCKSLEPKYKEAAEQLQGMKGYENVVMAKMDATANDVPSTYQVSGFPTIYWAPAEGKKSPMKYSGGREKDDFVEYIKREHKPKKTEL